MSNEAVIRAFLRRQKAHTPIRNIIQGLYMTKGCTLTSTGEALVNYTTVIAMWTNDIIELNTKKYSVTTTKIQNKIRELAKEYNIEILEV